MGLGCDEAIMATRVEMFVSGLGRSHAHHLRCRHCRPTGFVVRCRACVERWATGGAAASTASVSVVEVCVVAQVLPPSRQSLWQAVRHLVPPRRIAQCIAQCITQRTACVATKAFPNIPHGRQQNVSAPPSRPRPGTGLLATGRYHYRLGG